MIKEEENYWEDENNNKWNKSLFTKGEESQKSYFRSGTIFRPITKLDFMLMMNKYSHLWNYLSKSPSDFMIRCKDDSYWPINYCFQLQHSKDSHEYLLINLGTGYQLYRDRVYLRKSEGTEIPNTDLIGLTVLMEGGSK